jgi:tight adherence protein B
MGALEIGLILVIVLVGTGMVAAIVLNQKSEERRRALSVIRGQNAGDGRVDAKGVQDRRRAEIARKLKEQQSEKDKKKGRKRLTIKDLLMQAGIKITPRQYWMRALIFAVVMAVLAFWVTRTPFVVLMLFITAFLGLSKMFVKWKIARRQKKFLMEFADALEAMVRLLKAGMPVTEAISMIGREFTGPVGEEMSYIYDAQKVGMPLHEAVLECSRRMPLPEVQMFATGIAIQAQTGASLSEILLNLAGVIRARFKLKRKVKALSSEAKASAMIIGSLPVVVGGGMYAINPDQVGVLFTDPFGRVLLAGAVIWMGLGVLVMKMMINFKV